MSGDLKTDLEAVRKVPESQMTERDKLVRFGCMTYDEADRLLAQRVGRRHAGDDEPKEAA